MEGSRLRLSSPESRPSPLNPKGIPSSSRPQGFPPKNTHTTTPGATPAGRVEKFNACINGKPFIPDIKFPLTTLLVWHCHPTGLLSWRAVKGCCGRQATTPQTALASTHDDTSTQANMHHTHREWREVEPGFQFLGPTSPHHPRVDTRQHKQHATSKLSQ